MAEFKRSQIERLFGYYHYLTQHRDPSGKSVSSAELADFLEIDATQVRKDLAAAGIRGRQRVGYSVKTVTRKIRSLLGLDRPRNAVIVGAGRLGGAISEYRGFTDYGIRFVAFFDRDPRKKGTKIGGKPVYECKDIPRIVRKRKVELGVITVPAHSGQEAADRLVRAGIRVIWNFAHTNLVVPGNVFVRHEHISIGIAELAYRLKRMSRRR